MSGEMIQAEKVLKIGQRVEFFLEDDDIKYSSRIENIDSEHLIVAMPFDDKRRPVIPMVGGKLYAVAVGDQCRYRFFSVYKGNAHGIVPVWYITKPEIVEKHQNRTFVRAAIHIPLSLHIIDREGRQSDRINASTLDLSGSGVSFILPKNVAAGSMAAIEFHNLPGIGTLEVMSRVVRVLPLVPKERGYRIGVQFLNLSRRNQNSLIRFIFGELRAQLAKEAEEEL
ncbi:hypothetical protein TAMA11512_06460 [Selenomonas sp. TAMA-11512]|uniref:flagellar brake protein n=1 Tax=Selenomonas sp. TAMA-11512 TaxID=3095337 RepID=UPI0030910387|nr:hypothetical protein TAMA11512_06460 [Selenomonas sp. TAMA-11512]